MKYNGTTLESRGQEIVYLADGSEVRRVVYTIPDEWRFFIKHGGELVEVFHKSYYFSVRK